MGLCDAIWTIRRPGGAGFEPLQPSRKALLTEAGEAAAPTGASAMSMQSVVSPAITLMPPKAKALRHIPGDEGWPFIGRTLNILADPKGEVERMAAKYGPVYRSHVLGETSVTALGPEANELLLFDQQKLFSSTHGWEIVLGRLFPRGLMLLDFDEHRLHRRALSVAFKSGPMKSYLAALDAGIAARVAQWKAQPGPILFYPAMKQLTLDLAATSFLGADIGPEVDEITRAFVDMVAAAVTPIRRPLPGTQMARGVKGRQRIVAYFSEQIPIRRDKDGEDLFSQLCRATHEDGALLSTQDIVDHMSFLMMAAHDTLTSSLTSFIGELAANPEWQQRLREEVAGLGIDANDPSSLDNLEKMPLSEMAFKEAMRKKPPVPSIPRCAISASKAMQSRPARWSASIRCTRITCRRYGPTRNGSIRCAFPTRRSATVIALPGCRSAAARICVSACTSPTCRQNASRGTSCRISASRWSPVTNRTGRCGRSRSRGMG